MKTNRILLLSELRCRASKIWDDLCEIHPKLCGFDCPTIELNNRMWRCAGQCFQSERRVTLSTKFYDAGFASKMNAIILPHELIHQADFDLFGRSDKKCGHGNNWMMLMVQYGLTPDPLHDMHVTQQGEKKICKA